MLDNLPADEEKSGGCRNGVLSKDTKTYLKEATKQQKILKENYNRKNIYTQNQEKTIEIPWA